MAGTFSSTQITVKSTALWSSTPAGFTKVTALTAGTADDGYRTVALPTTFFLNGTGYTQIYAGTNGYITFSAGATTISVSTPSSPPGPSMRFGAGDRSTQTIYYGNDASTGAFLVRCEGSNNTAYSAGSAVFWEYYFFPDGAFMVAMGGNTAAMASGASSAWSWSSGSAFLTGASPGVILGATGGNTSAVYRTTDNGVTWTAQAGSYTHPSTTYWNLTDKNSNVKVVSLREIRNDAAGGWYSARSNTSKTTGKWYFEANYKLNNGNGVIVGIATASNTLGNYPGADPTSIGLWDNGGNWLGGSGSGSVGGIADGGIIGLVLDCDAKTLSATADGVNYTAVNTFSFAGPYYVIGSFNSGPVDIVAAWAAADFVYTPPTGATAWDATASSGGGTGNQNGALTDTGTISDASSASAAASAPLSDTRSATDTASATAAASAALSDTGAVSDSLSASASQAASLADTGAVSDSLASLAAVQGSLSDTGAVSDTTAASVAAQAALSDTGAASDNAAASAATSGALTDTGAISDARAVSVAVTGPLSDTGAVNDNTAASAAAPSALADTGAVTDTLTGSSANTGALADAGSTSDVATARATVSVALADTGAGTDITAAAVAAATALSDTGAIADTQAAAPAFVMALSDIGGASDAVTGSAAILLSGVLADAGSISDAVAVTAASATASLVDTGAIRDELHYAGEVTGYVPPPYVQPISPPGGGGTTARGSGYNSYDAELHRRREREEEEARRPKPRRAAGTPSPDALPALGSPLTIDLMALPTLPPGAALGELPPMPPLVDPMAALLADDEDAIALLLAA